MLLDTITLTPNARVTGAEFEKTLTQPDKAVVGIGTARWYPSSPIEITNIFVSVGVAPTGASLLVDVKKNGVSILGSLIEIVNGALTANVAIPTDIVGLTTDYYSVDITQIGAAAAGEDLSVRLIYEKTA